MGSTEPQDRLPHRIAYADDITLWAQDTEQQVQRAAGLLQDRLLVAGMEVKTAKCCSMGQHDPTNRAPVVQGIPVDSGLIVLGSSVTQELPYALGRPGQR